MTPTHTCWCAACEQWEMPRSSCVMATGSFNTSVSQQTLHTRVRWTFDRQTHEATMAPQQCSCAIAVVCSKHSPSTQHPLTALRDVRLSSIATIIQSRNSCRAWRSHANAQRTPVRLLLALKCGHCASKMQLLAQLLALAAHPSNQRYKQRSIALSYVGSWAGQKTLVRCFVRHSPFLSS